MFKKYGWIIAPLLIAALLCTIPFGHEHARADGIGASASCSLDAIEATIVCDSTAQQATMNATVQKGGYIVNGGSNSVFINFSGAAIAGTNAQNTTGEIEVPANGTIPVRPKCRVFSYKAASSTSVLYWFPSE